MTNRSDTPTIPLGTASPDELQLFTEAVKECMEVLEGKRGDGMDRALTPRDLEAAGILSLSSAGTSNLIINVGPSVTSSGSSIDEQYDYPLMPTNLTVTGTFMYNMLTWDNTNFHGYAHTEVWRSDTTNFNDAILVARPGGHIYSDIVGADATKYYWIRFVNKADQRGPYNDTAGTVGQTNKTVESLLAELEEESNASTLLQSLRSQLNTTILHAGPIAPTAHSNGRLLTAGDRWIDTQLDANQNTLNTNYRYTGTAWVNMDLATQTYTNAYVGSQIIDQVGYCQLTNAGGVVSVATAHGTKTACQDANTGETNGDVFEWKETGALASSLDTVSTTVGDHTTTINTHTQSIDGLRGEYSLKIDNDGRVTGFAVAGGAACRLNDAFDFDKTEAECTAAGGAWVTESDFIVTADKFKIASPDGGVTPFEVVTSDRCVMLDGTVHSGEDEATCLARNPAAPADPTVKTWIPAGTYMTNAFIQYADIDWAEVGTLNADMATIAGTVIANTVDADFVNSFELNLTPHGVGVGVEDPSTGSGIVADSESIRVYHNGVLRVKLGKLY